jgi:hypothetical protein
MYKWILGAVIGLSFIACLVVVKFGLKPKPIPIIKASNFEDPKLLSTYINRQLYQKLRSNPVIAFGFDKSNAYEKAVVDELIKIVTDETKENPPQFKTLTPEESFSGSASNRQKEFGEKFISFTVINLKGVAEAPEVTNCEVDHTYSVWLECMKGQKMRQINRAKKVKPGKPVGMVENQSQKDIMIYIREDH